MSKEAKIIKDLKERNDRLNNQYMQEQARNYHLNYVIDKYKSVLDEIREYIEHKTLYEEEYDYDYEENMYLSGISEEKAKEDLLQILDKVKE